MLETGFGKGHLTQVLCRKSGFLYAVELDDDLFEKTSRALSSVPNLRLIGGDFLQMSLPKVTSYQVFANIPFFITSPIVKKLTRAAHPPEEIWLVVERGAARRLMGLPRETMASLLLKAGWEAEIVYAFRREDFHPSPSVDTVLLHLSRKAAPDVVPAYLPRFERFVERSLSCGFGGKRGLLTSKQVSTALRLAHLPPLSRDGNTLYVQWLCLF